MNNIFEKLSLKVSNAAGTSLAFITASALVLIWLITGPLFNYSETWQLVINTGTTIITFLMVFLIQKSQNKESLSIQLKLNELIATNKIASNRLVGVEELTEEEMKVLRTFYSTIFQLSKEEGNLASSHSIEEAKDLNQIKKKSKPSLLKQRTF